MPCPSLGSNVLNTVQNVKVSCFCSDLKQFGPVKTNLDLQNDKALESQQHI